jgi:hypothetical protein
VKLDATAVSYGAANVVQGPLFSCNRISGLRLLSDLMHLVDLTCLGISTGNIDKSVRFLAAGCRNFQFTHRL